MSWENTRACMRTRHDATKARNRPLSSPAETVQEPGAYVVGITSMARRHICVASMCSEVWRWRAFWQFLQRRCVLTIREYGSPIQHVAMYINAQSVHADRNCDESGNNYLGSGVVTKRTALCQCNGVGKLGSAAAERLINHAYPARMSDRRNQRSVTHDGGKNK